MTAVESVDLAEIQRALELFIPDGSVFEIRVLDYVAKGGRLPVALSGFFDNAADAAREVGKYEAGAGGCYFTPNPLVPELLYRRRNRLGPAKRGESATDAHVTRRRWLLVDLDVVRVSGISSTDSEHAAALAMAGRIRDWLGADGWPDPVFAGRRPDGAT